MTKRADVVIHTFGEIEEALVEAVRQAIEQRLPARAATGDPRRLPPGSYSEPRGQYRSTEFLSELSRGSSDERMRLGITNVDLFVPDLNFVFGEASSRCGVAVFSIARLDPCFYGEHANSEKLTRRAIAEAVHELGHVFGLGHCDRSDCVMWFSNTLEETDRKGLEFCQHCAERIDSSRLNSRSDFGSQRASS